MKTDLTQRRGDAEKREEKRKKSQKIGKCASCQILCAPDLSGLIAFRQGETPGPLFLPLPSPPLPRSMQRGRGKEDGRHIAVIRASRPDEAPSPGAACAAPPPLPAIRRARALAIQRRRPSDKSINRSIRPGGRTREREWERKRGRVRRYFAVYSPRPTFLKVSGWRSSVWFTIVRKEFEFVLYPNFCTSSTRSLTLSVRP